MKQVQTLKGFRDFLPVTARKRQYVISTLKSVFESYGFDPLETPALEYEEILLGKYGEEGDKLMYRFADNGDRKVALRYDQTVPLARVAAQYQNELSFPFKRFQIQPVWRAENTQKGRYREFFQCDIDTVGTSSLLSDAEIIATTVAAYKKLAFKNIRVLLNDRRTFSTLPTTAVIIIDKLKKIGEEGVCQQLVERGISTDTQAAKILLDSITQQKPTTELQQVMDLTQTLGVNPTEMVYSPTLARGLDYYTGTIIEIECPEYPSGSLAGGGRYDNLIGMFSGKQIPSVGLAFGFDRTMEAMDELGLFPENLNTTQVLVTIFSSELKEKSMETASRLRSNNINVELYLDETVKMDKQLKYASQKEIPFIVIIGPDEAEKGIITLKNMKTRKQTQISVNEMIERLIIDKRDCFTPFAMTR